MNACSAALLGMHLMVHGLGLGPSAAKSLSVLPKPTAVASPETVQIGNENTLVNLQADGADMPTMLRLLSQRTHVGLVLLSPVDKKLTTNLVQVRFIDALDNVCKVSGLAYLKIKGTY